MYMDYLSGELTGDYSPEQYFDLYLYADLLGFGQSAGNAHVCTN